MRWVANYGLALVALLRRKATLRMTGESLLDKSHLKYARNFGRSVIELEAVHDVTDNPRVVYSLSNLPVCIG